MPSRDDASPEGCRHDRTTDRGERCFDCDARRMWQFLDGKGWHWSRWRLPRVPAGSEQPDYKAAWNKLREVVQKHSMNAIARCHEEVAALCEVLKWMDALSAPPAEGSESRLDKAACEIYGCTTENWQRFKDSVGEFERRRIETYAAGVERVEREGERP